MPAIAALVINDGAATPVAHPFSPVTTDGSLAKWADRSPSIPAGFRTFTQEVLEPAGNRTVHKITIGLYNPTVATVNGVDSVVRYQSAQVIFNFSPDSTKQERDDTRTYVENFIKNSTVVTSVEDVEPFY